MMPMSNAKDFLARWSQRKREAAEKAADIGSMSSRTRELDRRSGEGDPGPTSPSALTDGSRLSRSTAAAGAALDRSAGTTSPRAEFDLSQLPPLDSITAQTDIRPFLAPGVPVEVARAALRRVWAVDPAIRDHIGLAENSWDFNAPGSIPGFGSLEMTDELRQAVDRMLQRAPQEPKVAEEARPIRSSQAEGESTAPSAEAAPSTLSQRVEESHECDGTQQLQAAEIGPPPEVEKAKVTQSVSCKRHDGALPRVGDR
jgi:hypothetical protein